MKQVFSPEISVNNFNLRETWDAFGYFFLSHCHVWTRYFRFLWRSLRKNEVRRGSRLFHQDCKNFFLFYFTFYFYFYCFFFLWNWALKSFLIYFVELFTSQFCIYLEIFLIVSFSSSFNVCQLIQFDCWLKVKRFNVVLDFALIILNRSNYEVLKFLTIAFWSIIRFTRLLMKRVHWWTCLFNLNAGVWILI